jgi:hypothetical protein
MRCAIGVMWLAAALSVSGSASAQDWARAMFEQSQHNFGTVARSAKAEHRFVFSNPYVEDAHVIGVRSSCGCTSVRVEKPLVKTHEKSEIIATFNTRAFQGQRGATLTVTFDKPFYAEVQLHVSGYIRSDVVLEPGGVQFGAIEQGHPAESRVAVTYTGRSGWKIAGVQCSNPNLRGEVVETRRAGGQVAYDLKLSLDGDAPAGYLNEYVMLVTNDPTPTQILVAVEGRVQASISVSPAMLFMGVVPPGEKATKQLVVKGARPFRIIAIDCDDAHFEFDTHDAGTPKTLHLIPVTFSAGSNPGKTTQTIRIETDLGSFTPELSAYAVVDRNE